MFTDFLFCSLMFFLGFNSSILIQQVPYLPSLFISDSVDNLVGYLPFYKICKGKLNCHSDTFITIFSIYYLVILTSAFILGIYFECYEQVKYYLKKKKVKKLQLFKINRIIALNAFLPVFLARDNILVKYYVDYAIHLGLIGIFYYVIPINNYQKTYSYKKNLTIGNLLFFAGIFLSLV